MSYDIRFRVKVEGVDEYVDVGDCDANITWNVREIITRSTGLEWKNEENNGYCVDVIPAIAKGYAELVAHGDKYKQYEPTNGWGTVESTIRFFKDIMDAWGTFSRWKNPDLVKTVTFWIV